MTSYGDGFICLGSAENAGDSQSGPAGPCLESKSFPGQKTSPLRKIRTSAGSHIGPCLVSKASNGSSQQNTIPILQYKKNRKPITHSRVRKRKDLATLGMKTFINFLLHKKRKSKKHKKIRSVSSFLLPTDSGVAVGNLRFWAKKAACEAENLMKLAIEAG
ncbi:hypothetical protein RIF29_26617 [Crotalaria pallida]|uniref:Uncharacterized protein n=1 Tax=Crotalaria pallida TaxID=3830 RepID=A0AAN9ENI6_CROPI